MAKSKIPLEVRATGDGSVTIQVKVDPAMIPDADTLVSVLQGMLGNFMVKRTLNSKGISLGEVTAKLEGVS